MKMSWVMLWRESNHGDTCLFKNSKRSRWRKKHDEQTWRWWELDSLYKILVIISAMVSILRKREKSFKSQGWERRKRDRTCIWQGLNEVRGMQSNTCKLKLVFLYKERERESFVLPWMQGHGSRELTLLVLFYDNKIDLQSDDDTKYYTGESLATLDFETLFFRPLLMSVTSSLISSFWSSLQ